MPAVRAFNRFELKYVTNRNLVGQFREQLAAKFDRDPHGLDGFYPI